MNTLNASGRNREPLHVSHGSSPKKYLEPSPLHAGHAPCGELKEKRRGSISGKEKPSYGHMNFAETICDVPSASIIFTSPSDSWSALSIASEARSRAAFASSENYDTNISSTITSISCF